MLQYFLRQQLLRHHLSRARTRLRQRSAVMAEHTVRKCARMMKQSSFWITVRTLKWTVMAMVFRVSGSLGDDAE